MKNTKKGFTLVELLVVIAILAILATVAVVGYTSFIDKANLSNDQAAIAQMNTGLQAAAIPGGFENPSDAIDALYSLGWNLGKMQPYSNGFHYAYNPENNKMYLLDENDNVVYPEEADKSKLWGFYYDAVEGKLDGITNYIAMANITNALNFNQAFGDGINYSIDLNGYYIDLGDAGNDKVVVDNGAFVSGNVAKDESVKEYDIATSIEKVDGTRYEYTVFRDLYFDTHNKMSFDNCIFYNCSLIFADNVEFTNCTFVGGYSAGNSVIETRANEKGNFTIDIINCTFDNVTRGINIAGGAETEENMRIVNVKGCEFNGATVEKFLIQYASTTATLNVTDCKFNSLGAAPAVIRIHENLNTFVANNELSSIVDKITWTNNTIANDIITEKYVDVDGMDSADKYSSIWNNAKELDTTLTNKMK